MQPHFAWVWAAFGTGRDIPKPATVCGFVCQMRESILSLFIPNPVDVHQSPESTQDSPLLLRVPTD